MKPKKNHKNKRVIRGGRGETMDNSAAILVVDDEFGVRQSFNLILKDTYEVILAETGSQALEVLSKRSVDLVLLDILLPDMNGIEVLEKLKRSDPETDVIMVTAVNDVQTAVIATKLGAYEYIIKPFVVDELLALIHRVLEKRHLVREVAYLKDELNRYRSFEKMVGKDKKMMANFELIDIISKSDGTILIQGESGTGKELAARAIHNRSPRRNKPFVVLSCAAIPRDLMEGTLFGHEKGAYTGAINSRAGKLEIADQGTVFLDDIDCLTMDMQAKLLRVIQEREFERLGSTKIIKVDVRFVAASNKNLKDSIKNGDFREDLFYRLNVFPVILPPLRDRSEDIPMLLNHFLDQNAKRTGNPPKSFAPKSIELLSRYEWPGNIRELQNLVERLFTINRTEVIQIKDIPDYSLAKKPIKDMPLKEAVSEFEKQYISDILSAVDGRRNKAAEKLNIHRNTLSLKIKELNLAVK
jgi:DNA-binding NtrC family response regulator